MSIAKSLAPAVLASVCMFAGGAQGQTCASPTALQVPGNGTSRAGTLCGGVDSVALYCGGLDSAGKNDAIYTVNFAALGSNFRSFSSITLTGTGFTPVMYLYSGACASGDSCVASGDAATPIPNDASIGAGTYFLAVSAAASDASGACGAYALAVDGYVPVQLQSFSID